MKITRWNSTDPVAQMNERSGYFRKAAQRYERGARYERAVFGWTPLAAGWTLEADRLRAAARRLSDAALRLAGLEYH
jgi:hypothetical protein